MTKENRFQAQLIKRIKTDFEGCIVLKNDPNYIQGVPDLIVLYKDKWAALECKRDLDAHRQPNQEYYISRMDDMSMARFVCPQNEEDVLRELQQTFGS